MIVAGVTLAVLVFLMRGTGGFFSSRITLVTYFDNAEGLRNGQPVDLQGVAIGNVQTVRVTPDPKHADAPIEVVMRINKKYQPLVRQDAKATILTAGVLGESYVDIDNRGTTKPPVVEGSVLPSTNEPGLQDVVRSSQTTLKNLDVLVKRMDRIVANVEQGKGTVGELLSDPTMANKANAILDQVQGLINDVSNGKGTIGRLLSDKELADKFADAVDKLDRIVTETQSGKNNVGKILNDESLYKNLHQTVATANQLMQDVNAGKGPLGKMVRDEALAKKLDNTVSKLSSIADRLEAGEGSAGKFLRDPSFYDNTDQLLIESRNLVKAIRENPKKYLTFHVRIF